MSKQVQEVTAPAPSPTSLPTEPGPAQAKARRNPALQWLAPTRVGAVYVWIVIIIVFSVWAPETFPTIQTAKTILNQNSVTGIMALSLIVPLSARVFDLSIGYILGISTVLLAWLLVETSIPLGVAIVMTLAAGVFIGVVNGIIVVPAKIDSFIGTLASGALLSAVIILITNDQPIASLRLDGAIAKLSSTSIFGIAMPVFIMLAIAFVLWWLMEHTVTGRRLYATGFNEEAARLTGVPTRRLRFCALIVSAVTCTVAGVVLLSQIQSASPELGPPYLLDAYAAAFLGATQLRPGRFNVWGTVIGVLLVATGQTGLSQIGAPVWASSMFTGVVLLLALGITNVERGQAARRWVQNRRGKGSSSEAPIAASSPTGASS